MCSFAYQRGVTHRHQKRSRRPHAPLPAPHTTQAPVPSQVPGVPLLVRHVALASYGTGMQVCGGGSAGKRKLGAPRGLGGSGSDAPPSLRFRVPALAGGQLTWPLQMKQGLGQVSSLHCEVAEGKEGRRVGALPALPPSTAAAARCRQNFPLRAPSFCTCHHGCRSYGQRRGRCTPQCRR